MTRLSTYEIFCGESLPDLGLFLRENGVLIPALASGHTFELKVAIHGTSSVVFTKTTGITGQTGSTFPPLGTPNVVIAWAATGELDALTPGAYRAQLKITRTLDGKARFYQWLINANVAL